MANLVSYHLCSGDFASYSFEHREGFEWSLISDVPDWFSYLLNPYSGELIYFDFTVPAGIDDLIIEVAQSDLAEEESTVYTIIINSMVCPTVFENCCTNQFNIAWLNREGGWQNFIFTGVRELKVDIGGAKKFKNRDLKLKYSEIKDVYDGMILTTGDIPQSYVDILASLQYSIQAFLWNEATQLWDIDIIIDKRDFVKYKTDEKFFDVKIKFLYAEELLIQTQ